MFWHRPKLQVRLLVNGEVWKKGLPTRWLPYKPRWLNQLWAFIAGYFWLPCPLCKQYFGGHEWSGDYSIPNRIRPGISTGVCDRLECVEKARRITDDFHKSGGWADMESIIVLQKGEKYVNKKT